MQHALYVTIFTEEQMLCIRLCCEDRCWYHAVERREGKEPHTKKSKCDQLVSQEGRDRATHISCISTVAKSQTREIWVLNSCQTTWYLCVTQKTEDFHFLLVGFFVLFCFPFIFISWRLITLQHCSGFCHTLTWISHGFTCVPLPDPPSHLPLHPIPLGLPSAPGLSTCFMHPAWAGDLFHPR